MSNMNSGYIGYGMSVRATQAYANNEMPKSKWNKKAILNVIKMFCQDNQVSFDFELLKELSHSSLKDTFLVCSSWHHTSKMLNKTDFYSINESMLENLTNEKINALINEEKKINDTKKELQLNEELKSVAIKEALKNEIKLTSKMLVRNGFAIGGVVIENIFYSYYSDFDECGLTQVNVTNNVNLTEIASDNIKAQVNVLKTIEELKRLYLK